MLNQVNLIGNLGQDPELKYTSNDKPVCNFSLATSEHYNGENVTTWHRIIVWGKTAENCSQYLQKGSQVHVYGKIQYRDWEDKDSNKRTTTEIVAFKVLFLSKLDKSDDYEHDQRRQDKKEVDDLPF